MEGKNYFKEYPKEGSRWTPPYFYNFENLIF
jgi:hypothetical protein